jgi:hypothetical protein
MIRKDVMARIFNTVFCCMAVIGSDALESYDSGGSRVIPAIHSAQAERDLGDIREFIWKHWQSRRLGHIVVTWFSREGEPSTLSFFVQPNKEGRWCVSVQLARTLASRAPQQHARYESSDYTVCMLELKPAGVELRSGSADPSPTHGHRLLLVDDEGKVRAEI